jgi:hypothetical protein
VWRIPLFCLLFGSSAAGCGGAYGQGLRAFDEGRYPDAVGEFRRAERDFPDWSEARRTRYALYRGLSHLAVGDARETDRWLGYAKAAYDRHPDTFTDEERGRLLAAWRAVGRMPGEPAYATPAK